MRILLLTDHWAPEIGAPQRRWARLGAGLVGRGHELAVLAPSRPDPARRPRPEAQEPATGWTTGPGGVSRDATGARVRRMPIGPGGRGLARRAASQAATAACMAGLGARRFGGAHRPDVIIGSVPGLPILPAALSLGRALDTPVVIEMRDAWPDIVSSAHRWAPGAGSRAVGGALEAALRSTVSPALTAMQGRARAIVTTTESFAEVLRARGMSPVVTVRNTARPEDWRLAPVPAHREDDALHVLYLGTVGRAQGLVSAVHAAALARAGGVRLRLRVVGAGAQTALVRQEALRLDAPVELVGTVAHERVAEHYDWADTVLVSLQDWPSMALTVPSKLYEVMATGRHVSAAVSGESRAIVGQTGCGRAVAPQDPAALARLWTELAADRRRLRVAPATGWLRAHADQRRLVERYEALLTEVAGG